MIIHRFKTPLTLIVLVSVLSLTLLSPFSANAQQVGPTSVSSTIIGGLNCTVGGVLSTWIVNLIADQIFDWGISLTNLGGVWAKLGNLFVQNSVPILNKNQDKKESIMDVTARCFAREIMNDITARMIGSARTGGRYNAGYRGVSEPSFVRDWRQFLARAQHRGENVFRSVINSASLCNNVVGLKDLFNATGQPPINDIERTRVGNVDTFNRRINCTMPRGWTLQGYTNDFAGQGGWEALTRLAEPQNNYYGALLLSLGELAAQRAHEESSDAKEAANGFTARRGKPNNTCWVWSNNNRCVIYKDILTPGSIVGDAVTATINEELAWITNVDEWNELIQYVMGNIMSRILNLAEPSVYDQEAFDSERNYPPVFNNGGLRPPVAGPPGSTPIPPPTTAPPPGSVYLCASVNYVDGCELFSANDPDLTNNTIGNDIVSSVILPGDGTTVTLCEDTNYGGQCTTFTVSDPDISGPFFSSPKFPNDEASSVIVRAPTAPLPPTGTIRLCNTINFQGTCEDFNTDDPDLSNNTIGGDTASSIMVPPGTSVTICPDPNYGGTCIQFIASEPDFTVLVNFNDVASSVLFNPACSDGIDNEGDGLIDYPQDPDCASPSGTDEGQPPPPAPLPTSLFGPECSDGIDNDNDGETDFPNDTDCVDAFDNSEGLGVGT